MNRRSLLCGLLVLSSLAPVRQARAWVHGIGGSPPPTGGTAIRSTDNKFVDGSSAPGLVAALAALPDGTRIMLSVSGSVSAQVWPYAFAQDLLSNGVSRIHDKRFLLFNLAAMTRSAATGSGVGTWTFTWSGGSFVLTFNVDDSAPTTWDMGRESLAQYGGYPIPLFLGGNASDWAITKQTLGDGVTTTNAFTISASPFYGVSFAGTAGSATRTVGTPATGSNAYLVTLTNATLGQSIAVSFNVIAGRYDVDNDVTNARIGNTVVAANHWGDEVVITRATDIAQVNNPTQSGTNVFFNTPARAQRSGGPAAPQGPYAGDSWEPRTQRNAGWITIRSRTPWAVNVNRMQFTPDASGNSYLRYAYLNNLNNTAFGTPPSQFPGSSITIGHSAGTSLCFWWMFDSCVAGNTPFYSGFNGSVDRACFFMLDNCIGYNPAPSTAYQTEGISLYARDSQIVGNLIDGIADDGIQYYLQDTVPGSGNSKSWWNFERNKIYTSSGAHGDFSQLYGIASIVPSSWVTTYCTSDKIFTLASELGNVFVRDQGTPGSSDGQGSWAGDYLSGHGQYVSQIRTAGMVYVGSFAGAIGRLWPAPGSTARNCTLVYAYYLGSTPPGGGTSQQKIRIMGVGGIFGVADCALSGVVNPEFNQAAPAAPITDNNVSNISNPYPSFTDPDSLANAQYLEQVVDALMPLPGGPLTISGGASRVVGAFGTGRIDHLQRTYDPILLQPLAGQPTSQATWVVTTTPTGGTTVGSALSCNFSWNDTITSLAWQWMRNGVNISGATSPTYTCVSADSGTTVSAIQWVQDSQGNHVAGLSNGVAIT